MARKCGVSGVRGQFGQRVSHANNKTKHTFLPNVQAKRVYLADQKRFVRLKVSTRMIRTIDKLGLEAALKKHGMSIQQVLA
jgi:large subunit ribosomal protein L28